MEIKHFSVIWILDVPLSNFFSDTIFFSFSDSKQIKRKFNSLHDNNLV